MTKRVVKTLPQWLVPCGAALKPIQLVSTAKRLSIPFGKVGRNVNRDNSFQRIQPAIPNVAKATKEDSIMPKTYTKATLTAAQKVQVKAGKILVNLYADAMNAKDGGIARFNAAMEYLNTLHRIVTQEGDGKGKRTCGSQTHETPDLIRALDARVNAGNVPTID